MPGRRNIPARMIRFSQTATWSREAVDEWRRVSCTFRPLRMCSPPDRPGRERPRARTGSVSRPGSTWRRNNNRRNTPESIRSRPRRGMAGPRGKRHRERPQCRRMSPCPRSGRCRRRSTRSGNSPVCTRRRQSRRFALLHSVRHTRRNAGGQSRGLRMSPRNGFAQKGKGARCRRPSGRLIPSHTGCCRFHSEPDRFAPPRTSCRTSCSAPCTCASSSLLKRGRE